AIAAVLGGAFLAANRGFFPEILQNLTPPFPLFSVYFVIGIFAALAFATMTVITRCVLTHWRTIGVAICLFLLGLSLYLYLPLASMTNPPVNWGYPRTVEGFIHTITRGQFEHLNPTDSLDRFAEQVWVYATQAGRNLG